MAYRGDEIVGVLPCFLKEDKENGSILNSLPFYGSNGGVVTYESGNYIIHEMLLNAFKDLAREKGCISSTIVTSPFESDLDIYTDVLNYTHSDSRIGQFSVFDDLKGDTEIMNLFHSKTRNMIRKAAKNNLEIKKMNDENFVTFLFETHVQNMNKIGGIPKEKEFFEIATSALVADKDYNIYVAFQDKTPIAALLLFYYNSSVEYFCPVIVEQYRTLQPLSLIIYTAMLEAIEKGYVIWNWGGTWDSQEGVYRFKKRWNAKDFQYFYYTNIYDDKIYAMEKEKMLSLYKYFYTLPFSVLKQRDESDA